MTDEQKERINLILERYKDGTCTPEDTRLLHEFYIQSQHEKPLPSDIEIVADLLDMQSRIDGSKVIERNNRIFSWKIYAIAAAALACIVLGVGLWNSQNSTAGNDMALEMAKQILPGKNRALLIIEGQDHIEIDGEQDSIVTSDGRTSFGDGKVIDSSGKTTKITIKTPNAGQFEAILPDGTKVWLNAASSVTYPSTFHGKYREIEVDGEVFLKVVKNSQKPFIVSTSKQKIEVLGTSFNVEAYDNQDAQKTTLEEGSLRIIGLNGQGTKVIKPGEQAIVDDLSTITIKEIGTDAVSSWKDGIYVIQDLTLEEFGKQLARWYDIEVNMGLYKKKRLSAMIPRDVPLADVLEAITLNTQINFNVKGRRINAIN